MYCVRVRKEGYKRVFSSGMSHTSLMDTHTRLLTLLFFSVFQAVQLSARGHAAESASPAAAGPRKLARYAHYRPVPHSTAFNHRERQPRQPHQAATCVLRQTLWVTKECERSPVDARCACAQTSWPAKVARVEGQECKSRWGRERIFLAPHRASRRFLCYFR